MTEHCLPEKAKDSCWAESGIGLEEVKKILKDVMPVEGYVDSEMFARDGSLTFVFKDYYNEDKWDVADLLCKLTINPQGLIEIVEHDLPGFINHKNQRIILFLASLVGKSLNYKVKDDGVLDPLEPVVDYLYEERD